MARAFVTFTLLALAAPAGLARAQQLIVRDDDTPLLEQCAENGAVLARLPTGHPVTLRFAIAGVSSSCYSVWTRLGGTTLSGYLRRDSLEGATEFERGLREASAARLVEETIKTIRIPGAPRSETEGAGAGESGALDEPVRLAIFELKAGRPSEVERILANARPPSQSREAAWLRAQALLQLTRPREALEIVRPALAAQPDDPGLLAVAGLSAYLADEPQSARAYLRRSLEQEPNPGIEEVLSRLEKELAADESTRTAYGTRFVLRYENGQLPLETTRRLVEMFEAEANRISLQLGCPLPLRQPVIVQSVENYRSATGSASWSAGHYDGRIRIAVPLPAEAVSHVREVFAHEYVHSCLARMARWPAWFHEGMAQRLSGESQQPVDPFLRRFLFDNGALPALDELGEDWRRLSERQAAVAYSLSLAAVNLLYEKLRPAGVRNLLGSPERLPELSAAIQNELRERLTH